MLNLSEITLQINDRFFEALTILKRQRLLGGANGFAKKYDIALANLYTIKTKRKGVVKPEYLYYLVKDYGVSAMWLLTGEGEMFTQTNAKTEESQSPKISASDYYDR